LNGDGVLKAMNLVGNVIEDYDSVEKKKERLAKEKLDLEIQRVKDMRTKQGLINKANEITKTGMKVPKKKKKL
jgi:hypothetical protein